MSPALFQALPKKSETETIAYTLSAPINDLAVPCFFFFFFLEKVRRWMCILSLQLDTFMV
jgi:hypothetical protein